MSECVGADRLIVMSEGRIAADGTGSYERDPLSVEFFHVFLSDQQFKT